MDKDALIVNGRLSTGNKAFYDQNGYAIAPALLHPEEIAALRRETIDIFRGKRGSVEGFLDTGDLEDAALLSNYVAIHFPHKLSALLRDQLAHPAVVQVLQGLIGPNIKCMQSMLFVKGPGKAGQSWHQDEYYIPTRDRSLTGCWIAIDDADTRNGCLWMIPGTQQPAYLHRRVANQSSEYADIDTIDVRGMEDRAIPVEVKSGSVVFFNGYVLHSSRRNNTSDCFRMALVNHYMSAESMLPWDQDGRLEPSEDLRDIIMIAGEDPYAWKGTVDVNKPYLRPEILKIKTSL